MTVTSNLTNLTLAEAADSASWDDLGGGAGSGQDDGLPIQGVESRSRRVDAKTLGFGFDFGSLQDLSVVGTHVGIWAVVLQPGQVTTLQFCFSDSATNCQSGNWDGHDYAGSNYPAKGGWQRVWIDLSRTRDAGSGTLVKTGVQNFGCEFTIGNVGGNANNCHLDRMDYSSTGLRINGGSGGTPTNFQDAIDDDTINSYGVIDSDFINGPVEIGGAATVFIDTNFAFKAGSQPLASATWQEVRIINNTVGMIIVLGSYFLQRIQIVVTGTSSSIDLGTGTLLDAGIMTWNSNITFKGSLVSSDTLTWGQSVLNGTTFDKSTGSSSALLCDENIDLDGLLDDCVFISNSNHAMELGATTPITINIRDQKYTDYNGATGSNLIANSGPTDAVIYNNSGKEITINVLGVGDNISVRNGIGATTIVVAGTKTKTITGLPVGCEARVLRGSFTLGYEDNILDGDFVHTYTADNRLALMRFTLGGSIIENIEVVLDSNDQTIPATVRPDPSYI